MYTGPKGNTNCKYLHRQNTLLRQKQKMKKKKRKKRPKSKLIKITGQCAEQAPIHQKLTKRNLLITLKEQLFNEAFKQTHQGQDQTS